MVEYVLHASVIRSLAGGNVECRTHPYAYKTAYTDARKTHYIVAVYTIVFLTMNPRVRNM